MEIDDSIKSSNNSCFLTGSSTVLLIQDRPGICTVGPNWINVKERLPRKGRKVLMIYDKRKTPVYGEYGTDGFW